MIVPHRTLPIPPRRIGSPQASEGYSNDATVSLALQRCNLDLNADKRVTLTPASAWQTHNDRLQWNQFKADGWGNLHEEKGRLINRQ
ncbi:hypothetical protein CGRA01v4_03380 [Colletotrichum graminicola]|nr:hypothetical protein CGRA01v4_03380 [Colletotrichum graminicola]